MPTLFDRAALSVVDGDERGLGRLLDESPQLVHETSPAPYRATLLHHVAANGIPDELQRTPPNIVRIAELLLERGAAPDALADSYGGGSDQTPLCLVASSWHPFERGVQEDLIRTLVEGGAQVDGIRSDGAPLTTALTFGYTGAARTLAELGARVDNLLLAAGLGRLEQVRAFLEPDPWLLAALGTYRPVLAGPDTWGESEALQHALHFAVTHGHEDVAGELLARGAQVDGKVTGHHCQLPLLQALFVREYDMVSFLVRNGASPALVDAKRGTSARDHARQAGPEVLALLDP